MAQSATPVGAFTFGQNGTYVIDHSQTGAAAASVPTSVGTRHRSIARYRQYAQFGWSFGPGARPCQQLPGWLLRTLHPVRPDRLRDAPRRLVPVWDLRGRYTGFKATFTLGVRNAMDTAPPLSNHAAPSRWASIRANTPIRGRATPPSATRSTAPHRACHPSPGGPLVCGTQRRSWSHWRLANALRSLPSVPAGLRSPAGVARQDAGTSVLTMLAGRDDQPSSAA